MSDVLRSCVDQSRTAEILLASMPELKVWYATVQISWIGQWKNWSAWIGKLER